MFVILHALGMLAVDLFKSRSRLEAENLFLRHQLNIALRRAPPRLRLRGSDRALLILITKLWPSLLGVAKVVQPETILRWHRAGFKVFWRCKPRNRAGRPKIDRGLRDLIQRMSRENPLWGASRIHGELLMLGFEVAQSTVSKYMARPSKPPSQTWRTFLQNHAEAIAAIDMCVVPTLSFDLLFAFLILGYAPGITERCPLSSNSPTIGHYCCHSDLGRVASRIRPDMIFGKDSSTQNLSAIHKPPADYPIFWVKRTFV